MRNLWKMFKLISWLPGIKGLIAAAVFINLFEGVTSIIRPYIFKLIVDKVVVVGGDAGRAARGIGQYLSFLALLSLVVGVLGYISTLINSRMIYGVDASLRRQTFQRLQELSLDYFETHRVGELSQKLNQGISDFSRLLDEITSSILTQIVTILLSLALIWRLSLLAGLVSALAIPISLGFNMYAQKFRRGRRPGGRTRLNSSNSCRRNTKR